MGSLKTERPRSASGFTKKKPIAEKRIVKSPKKPKTGKKVAKTTKPKTTKPKTTKPKIKIQVKKGRVEMFVSA